MKTMLFYIGLILWAPLLVAGDMDYSAKLSLKTKYLGKLGTTVDDNNVLQPYVELNHKSGLYGYLWLNLPLKEGNPKRSLEIEPSLGYRKSAGEWTWDASLTLFDIQNPGVLDFTGDILSPKIKLSNPFFYTEAIYYAADSGRNGWLVGVGANKNLRGAVSLSGNINYVEGPLDFEPILYAKFKALVSLNKRHMDLFVEIMQIVHRESANDPRRDQVALGLSYSF